MNLKEIKSNPSKTISRFNKDSLKKSLVGESSLLIISQGIAMGLSMLITLVRPRLLSVEDIGLIAFIAGIVSFISGFFTLGIDNSIGRLIINNEVPSNKNKYYNYMGVIGILLAFIMGVALLSAIPILPLFGRGDAARFLPLIFPFAGYNVLKIFMESGSIATGRIKLLSLHIIAYPILYLVTIAIFYYMGNYNIHTAIISEYTIHFFVAFIPLVLTIKHFSYDKKIISDIKIEQRIHGWKIYISRIIFIPTFNLDVIILGAFHPLSIVGVYSMSNLIASPISVIGQSFSKSMYRRFGKNSISKKHLRVLSLVSLLFSIVIFLIGYIAIKFYLGKDYMYVLLLLPFSIVVYNIRGITSTYTYFMNAKGLSNEVRKCAVVGLILNLVLNFGLIIPFGAIGGMSASIIVLAVNLLMRMHYVNRFNKSIN